jgi:hypothetical protein
MEQHIDPRWLPAELTERHWFTLDDVTALALGDWVFNPASWAHYAGQVVELFPTHVEIRWHKTPDDVFFSYEPMERVAAFWWVDPVMQEVPSAAH